MQEKNSANHLQRPEIVALTGFMGSGKTTAGRALAELLGWKFVDLDEFIEQRAGIAIREIFAQRGEAEFRRIESAALRELLGRCVESMVIALGGGTFVQPDNAEALRLTEVRTVFLDLPLNEMLARCAEHDIQMAAGLRPLAQDEQAFRWLFEARLPFYRKAEIAVSAQEKSAIEIAREIATRLQITLKKR